MVNKGIVARLKTLLQNVSIYMLLRCCAWRSSEKVLVENTVIYWHELWKWKTKWVTAHHYRREYKFINLLIA